MAITYQDRQEWARNPITEEFLATLKGTKQEAMEIWATEGYIGTSGEQTLQQNATALGGIRVLDQAIGIIESYLESEGD